MKAIMKEKDDYYIAMELCNGGDLSKFLDAKGGYLSEVHARQIMIQIMRGIAAMH